MSEFGIDLNKVEILDDRVDVMKDCDTDFKNNPILLDKRLKSND